MKNLLLIIREKLCYFISRQNKTGKTTPETPSAMAQQGSVLIGQDAKPNNGLAKKVLTRRGSTQQRKPKWTPDSWPITAKEGFSRFHDFPIAYSVMHAIADLGFEYCTPVQEQALKDCLAGRDLVVKANTGTGKTAVFLITILTRLSREKRVKGKKTGQVRALVLAPTRELVMQIGKDARQLGKYSHLSVRTVFGGTDYQKQQDLLREKPCDLLVATPGRLLDFLGKKIVRLNGCTTLILDEADRMLDMGFIPDVRRIVGHLQTKEQRQTLLFSATITDDVTRLAQQWCKNVKMVNAEPAQMATESVRQVVYLASSNEKFLILCNLAVSHPESRIIVFTNMKGEARRLSEKLTKTGIANLLLTGDVAQQKRMKRLERFRHGKIKVLVATDVAGRGIHIDDIQLVVNFTLPYEPEDYVHRIGRTGRAGADGQAVSFACEEGAFYLPAIEELLGEKLVCILPEEQLLQPVTLPKLPHTTQSRGKKQYRRSQKNSKSGNILGTPAKQRNDGKTGKTQ